MVVTLAESVATRSARMNSSAVDESNPRVELGESDRKRWFSVQMKRYVLVPTNELAPCGHGFCNRHPLLLATRNPSQSCITNDSIPGVFESKDAHQRFCCKRGVCRSGLIVRSAVRGPHRRCKSQCFSDFERWEVDIILRAVYHITSVPFVDLFGDERVVENISHNIIVVSAMVGESF